MELSLYKFNYEFDEDKLMEEAIESFDVYAIKLITSKSSESLLYRDYRVQAEIIFSCDM